MSSGIRAEVRIDSPERCPVARVSAATGLPSYTISKSVAPEGSETVTEEFVLNTGEAPEGSRRVEFPDPIDDIEVDEVFSYGSKGAFRFTRPRGWGCPCECVERFDCPILDVHTRDGALFLAFHVRGMNALQRVIRTLRERYPGTDVLRLLRSTDDRTDDNLVFVDRSELTDRQREVLETAHEMGYFDHPKGANAGEVAEALGITTSTFTEHLSAAQRKLLGAILEA